MSLSVANSYSTARPASGSVEIGLLNILPDSGFERGERQIVDLLAEISSRYSVRLSLFSLSSIERGTPIQDRIKARYRSAKALRGTNLDGLIVTGCEPRTDALPKESFWSELTEVIDWAEHMTSSAIWSCLSAHAAVLHLDGLTRRRLPEKRSGVYIVSPALAHPLIDGAPSKILVPHSRWNEVDRDDLIATGYRILTSGALVGVDTFMKEWRSLFIYLQGHPEYDHFALAREFRRDTRRYFEGRITDLPRPPENYFDCATEWALNETLTSTTDRRLRDLPDNLTIRPEVAEGTRIYSRCLFKNWLSYIATRRDKPLQWLNNDKLHAPIKEPPS